MKTINTFIANPELVNYLASLYYEVESRKMLLAYLFSKDDINQEAINKYHKEYQDFMMQYDFAKIDFEINIIKKKFPNCTHWHLNFYTGEVTVTLEENNI